MAEKVPLPAGIPPEREFLRRYLHRTGLDAVPRDYEFCVAFAILRLAAILQGIVGRAPDGTAASAKAAGTGMKASGIADAAWRSVKAHFSDAP